MRASAPRPPGTRRALVVATGAYADPEITQLRAPATDAQGMVEVLTHEGIGGFDVTSLVDAREHEIRRTVSVFLAECGRDDLVLVYLSCHGLLSPRGRLYFAAADTEKAHLRATAIESEWLLEAMDECAARRQVLILDCCFSGAFAGKGATDLELDRRLGGAGRGRAVLTASRSTEYSFEGEPLSDGPKPGSVFTSALVEGLRTGEADRDGDGYVSVEDAFLYAAERVASRQNPQRWLYGGEEEIILARSPRGVAVVAAQLPEALRAALDSPLPNVRRGAVESLAEMLTAEDPGLVLAARQALQVVASQDAPAVARLARELLGEAPSVPAAAPPVPPQQPPPSPRPQPESRSLRKGFPGRINALAFSPSGQLLAAAAANVVAFFDVKSGEPVGDKLRSDDEFISTIAFSPRGDRIATGGDDHTVRLWNVPQRKLLHPPWPSQAWTHQGSVRSVVFTPGGDLASAGDDGKVRLWDHRSRIPKHATLFIGRQGINSIAFHPLGAGFALGCNEQAVLIRDGSDSRPLRSHTDDVLAVAYHPSGQLLASGGRDRTVRLWQTSADNRQPPIATVELGEWVTSLAFSLNGVWLAATSRDGHVHLHHSATLEAFHSPLTTHSGGANAVAFSPDGRFLASGGNDGVVQLLAI
ncbi:hypothetical protein GCM10009687_07230 [Asanoa iriomotensis]|uniref:Peptidase C14 caspase domain-containing protein n=2 Tax=Asanoa iriomotensis TaxID=234613 RepID=A0ABQ4CBA7_9ACTN|nr:hypothetical protein Air01nite_61430 [Asanoa iriomotensis]